MTVFSTAEQVETLKQRALDWEQDGFPGIDEKFKVSMPLLNRLPHVAPVYSCTGHVVREVETKRTKRSDFYIIFAATEEGFAILSQLYLNLQKRLIDSYTRRHLVYKELVAQLGKDHAEVAKFLFANPLSLPTNLRLTHTVRVWPISTEGGVEELHDGDTDFYNVVLLGAQTGNTQVINDFMCEFDQAVAEIAQYP
jgi:hypothetical protein